MQKLSELETAEVSLVPKGANKKKFLIFKSRDNEETMTHQDLEKIVNADPETLKKVEAVLKEAGYQSMSPSKVEGTVYKEPEELEEGEEEEEEEAEEEAEMEKMKKMKKSHGEMMEVEEDEEEDEDMEKCYKEGEEGQEQPTVSERAQTALKAIARIHAPFKEEISPEMVSRALASDASGGFFAGRQGVSEDKGERPKPVSEEHHEQAHDHALKAYQKAYDEHVSKLGHRMYPDAQMEMKSEGKTMEEKMEKSAVKKEDLLATLPKEARKTVEAIFKQNQTLEKIVKEERELRLTKEFQEIAKSYKNLGVNTEELGGVLKTLAEADKTTYEKVEKMLRAADEQIGHGKLFSEVGTNLSEGTLSAEKKIDAAVNEIVKKSSGMSKEEAYAEFIQTSEGQKLYEQYKATRKGGI